jgi:glycosyltransferase involved in cell wall biosynthesis
MLVQLKASDSSHVIGLQGGFSEKIGLVRSFLDRLPACVYPRRTEKFWGVNWLPMPWLDQDVLLNADIVHLHWFCAGYLPINYLKKIKKPIVWTLHDMWAFTGGCHYVGDCRRYTGQCGKCPQLGSDNARDLSYKVWRRKHYHWSDLDLTLVTPSRWLAKCTRQSSLLGAYPLKEIPYNIDSDLYKPQDRYFCRKALGLPVDKKLILFGAVNATSDQRKGFQHLYPAMQSLTSIAGPDQMELMIYGAPQPVDPPDFGFPVHYYGEIHDDEKLALLFSAADVVVAPSREDNLPLVVMEALACGTPCVAFDIGGMSDMIDHGKNGYLAKAFDVEDLSRGVHWVLEDVNRLLELSKNARTKVMERFTTVKIVNSYLELYEQILG